MAIESTAPAGVDIAYAHGPARFQWIVIAHSTSARKRAATAVRRF